MNPAPDEALASAAAALVGCRFRLHGRDPATGLDCVGLVGAALAAIGRPAALPGGYALRSAPYGQIAASALAHGFVSTAGAVRAGELWLLAPGPGQAHLALIGPGAAALVEAHAGLRRVVATPLETGSRPLEMPLEPVARWSLASARR